MSGWIKLHRNIIDWEWYTDGNTCRLFVHLLIKANHADKKWRGYIIQRGELISSAESLGQQINLSRQQIRTSIDKLKSTNDITTLSRAQHTVFTINNYEKYQEVTNEATMDQPALQPADQPLNNHKQECKEVKKLRKESNRFTPPSLDEIKEYILNKTGILDESLSNKFFNHYESNGWKVGKNSMKNWNAAINQWLAREKSNGKQGDALERLTDTSFADGFRESGFINQTN